MKRAALTLLATLGLITFGCSKRADFVPVLRNEIALLGGRTNDLVSAEGLVGRWTTSRDQVGVAIDTKEIRYDDLMNLLKTAYGEPQLYLAADERRAATFLWPSTNAGIVIYIRSKGGGAELTLTKPIMVP